MTRAEYVSRISSLTQELTGLAAEYFSTQRDPYEVAGERFNQAVDAFEQDLSTRTAELEAREAAANAAVDAVAREQEQTRARLVEAIQQGDTDSEQAATAELDKLAAKKRAADTRADAFKGAKVYGSKDLFNAAVAHMRDRMAIKSCGMGNDRKDVVDAIRGAVKQLTELLPSGADTSWYAERADAKRCFSIFEKTVGHIDLTAPGCGGPDDVKVRIGLSLAKKEIAPGLDGTPSGAALSAIFEEWDSQPEEESETD